MYVCMYVCMYCSAVRWSAVLAVFARECLKSFPARWSPSVCTASERLVLVVCMYVCMYSCMYVLLYLSFMRYTNRSYVYYMYTYIHTYIHTYIRLSTYIHTYIHTYRAVGFAFLLKRCWIVPLSTNLCEESGGDPKS